MMATNLSADVLADFPPAAAPLNPMEPKVSDPPSGGQKTVRHAVLAKRELYGIQPPTEPAEPVPVKVVIFHEYRASSN